MTERARPLRERALDLLLAVGICAFALLLVRAQLDRSQRRTERGQVLREAGLLYEALERYHERHGSYPPTHGQDRLELASLEPLVRRGYYTGGLLERLDHARLDGYEAPAADEFWLELTVNASPPVRLVVAHSDDAPLGGGGRLDGVYLYEDGRLHRR